LYRRRKIYQKGKKNINREGRHRASRKIRNLGRN
jgi:hypothetical protein